MKRKIVVGIILVFLLNLILVSCDPYSDVRPDFDPEVVWVCEQPFAYFKYDEELDDFPGKLIYNDTEYDFFELEAVGSPLRFMKPEAYKENSVSLGSKFTYLHGFADYKEGYFTYEIENDYDNIFNGEVTEMLFTKYTVAEFEEKFGELRLDAKFPEFDGESE